MNTTGLLSGLLLHGLTEHYNRRGRRSAERAKQEELRRLEEQKEAEVKKIMDWGYANFPPYIAQEIAAKVMGAPSPMKVMTDASNILLNKGKLDLDKQRLDRQREVDEGRLDLDKQRLDRQRDVDAIMAGFKADELEIKKQAAAGGSGTGAPGSRGSNTLQILARTRQAIREGQEEVLNEAGNTIGTAYPPEYLEVLKELERRLIKQLEEEEGLFADTPESLENRKLLKRFDKFLSDIFDRFNDRTKKRLGVDASVAGQMKKEAQNKEAKKNEKEARRVRPVGTSGRPSEHYLPLGPSYGRPGLIR